MAYDQLKIDIDAIESAGTSLQTISNEFGTAGESAQDAASAVGHEQLGNVMRDFAGNWDDRRKKLKESIDALATATTQIAKAFRDTDTALAEPLANSGGSAVGVAEQVVAGAAGAVTGMTSGAAAASAGAGNGGVGYTPRADATVNSSAGNARYANPAMPQAPRADASVDSTADSVHYLNPAMPERPRADATVGNSAENVRYANPDMPEDPRANVSVSTDASDAGMGLNPQMVAMTERAQEQLERLDAQLADLRARLAELHAEIRASVDALHIQEEIDFVMRMRDFILSIVPNGFVYRPTVNVGTPDIDPTPVQPPSDTSSPDFTVPPRHFA